MGRGGSKIFCPVRCGYGSGDAEPHNEAGTFGRIGFSPVFNFGVIWTCVTAVGGGCLRGEGCWEIVFVCACDRGTGCKQSRVCSETDRQTVCVRVCQRVYLLVCVDVLCHASAFSPLLPFLLSPFLLLLLLLHILSCVCCLMTHPLYPTGARS